jgi:hypothetical protein
MKATKLLGRKRGRMKKWKVESGNLKPETSVWEGERKTTVGGPIRGRRQSAISNRNYPFFCVWVAMLVLDFMPQLAEA